MIGGSTLALLKMIASDDERSLAISRVICRLVKDGLELGEVRSDVMVVDGVERHLTIMPEHWVDRLVLAAERGAFERMPEDRIVERLLSPHKSERSCLNGCGITKVGRHEVEGPRARHWTEFWRDGEQIVCDGTPPCEPFKAAAVTA